MKQRVRVLTLLVGLVFTLSIAAWMLQSTKDNDANSLDLAVSQGADARKPIPALTQMSANFLPPLPAMPLPDGVNPVDVEVDAKTGAVKLINPAALSAQEQAVISLPPGVHPEDVEILADGRVKLINSASQPELAVQESALPKGILPEQVQISPETGQAQLISAATEQKDLQPPQPQLPDGANQGDVEVLESGAIKLKQDAYQYSSSANSLSISPILPEGVNPEQVHISAKTGAVKLR